MKIMQKTDGNTRYVLALTTKGIESYTQRTKAESAGGGWYNRQVTVVPWPWRSLK